MKILLISHGAGPYGAERVVIALARGLASRGHDVVLEFPHPGPAVDIAGGNSSLECRVGDRHRLPRNGREAGKFFATGAAAIRNVQRSIRHTAPDLVWLNSVYNPWAAVATSLSRRPVVWHVHEHRLPDPLGLATAALLGFVATRIVVVSRFLADGWARYPWLRRRLSVIPNPLFDEVEPLTPPPDPPFTVGCVGQLEPRKRVPDVVHAIARFPDVDGIIVGDGKARDATESAIRDEGVQERVEMTGYRPDIREQMARFHCIAIPAVREPFGLVALEAMAAGVPVIAARSGALPEVLGPAALYHAPGNIEELTRRIEALKENPGLRQELVDRGRRRLIRFREHAWLDSAEETALAAMAGTR